MTKKREDKNIRNNSDLTDVLKKNIIILEDIKKISEETRKRVEEKYKKDI